MGFLDDFSRLLNGCSNSGTRLARNDVAGLEISTIFAHDLEVYETAIIDANGAYPVERYETRDQAVAGHEAWCAKAPTLAEVTKLGFRSLIGDGKIVLVRRDDG